MFFFEIYQKESRNVAMMEVIAFGFVLDETSYLRDVGLPGGFPCLGQRQGLRKMRYQGHSLVVGRFK